MSRSAIATSVAIIVALAVPALAQRPNQGEDESAALVAEGRAALERFDASNAQSDLADADKALEQAINLNPRRVEAYVLRAAVFTARKQ